MRPGIAHVNLNAPVCEGRDLPASLRLPIVALCVRIRTKPGARSGSTLSSRRRPLVVPQLKRDLLPSDEGPVAPSPGKLVSLGPEWLPPTA